MELQALTSEEAPLVVERKRTHQYVNAGLLFHWLGYGTQNVRWTWQGRTLSAAREHDA